MANHCVSISNQAPFSALHTFVVEELQSAQRETCERLQLEGIFAANKQLPMPWDFNDVLVITPVDAPGLTDFLAEANRLQQSGLCCFTLASCQLQGGEAARTLCDTLQTALATWLQIHAVLPDAVLIVHAGEHAQDLTWLDDFDLARYVGGLHLPVWTGIRAGQTDSVLEQVVQQRFDSPSLLLSGIKRRTAERAAETVAMMASISRRTRRYAMASRRSADKSLNTVSQHAMPVLEAASTSSAEMMRVILERALPVDQSNQGRRHD